jgi:hypothetical protein
MPFDWWVYAVCSVAVSIGSFWFGWWLLQDYQFNDYTEELNDGCVRVISGANDIEN